MEASGGSGKNKTSEPVILASAGIRYYEVSMEIHTLEAFIFLNYPLQPFSDPQKWFFALTQKSLYLYKSIDVCPKNSI